MLPVVWSVDAESDLFEIITYIGERNFNAAEKLWNLLNDSVLLLSQHPYLYRQSERILGAREIVVHPNYVVVYKVSTTSIEVLRVLHARQEFP